jgi:hypothetical protein
MPVTIDDYLSFAQREQKAADVVTLETRNRNQIREAIDAQLRKLSERIVEGEEFDPHEFLLWAALTFPYPSEAYRSMAKRMDILLRRHTGEMMVYSQGRVGWPLTVLVATIGAEGLTVERNDPPIKEGEPGYGIQQVGSRMVRLLGGPAYEPLLLRMPIDGSVTDFSFLPPLAVEDGHVVPGTFTDRREIPNFSRHLLFEEGELFLHFLNTIGLEESNDLFYRGQGNARRRHPNLESVSIIPGNKRVIKYLTQRTGLDFSEARSPQDVYQRLGGK